MTLFTGVYPPSPPARIKESYPELEIEHPRESHDGPESDAQSFDSSVDSLPPKPLRQPYSSRLKAQHLALSVLPDLIEPPSRETSPESWKRAATIRNEIILTLNRFKEEHRSAECGTAYIGDKTQLSCTRFARCEWIGLRRKKRRVGGVEEVWDVGFGMGCPPLVDTDTEWEEWERKFEARKIEVYEEQKRAKLARIEARRKRKEEKELERRRELEERERERRQRKKEKLKRSRTAARKKTPVDHLLNVSVEAPESGPTVGLDTRVENWRNAVLPSSQIESSQIDSQVQNASRPSVHVCGAPAQDSAPQPQPQAADVTVPGFPVISVRPSQSESELQYQQSQRSQPSTLSFKVVKSHASALKKGDNQNTSTPRIARREMPPSVPIEDPLQDILVESSQLQPSSQPQQGRGHFINENNKEEEEEEGSADLHANGESRVLNETQETEHSLRIISAYAADNPAQKLRLDHAPISASQDPADFDTIESWSNSYPQMESRSQDQSQYYSQENELEISPEQYLDSQKEMVIPGSREMNEGVHLQPHLLPVSTGSGVIDLSYGEMAATSCEPVNVGSAKPSLIPIPELRLSDIMHVEGDLVMRKGDLSLSGGESDKERNVVEERKETLSFTKVIHSMPLPVNDIPGSSSVPRPAMLGKKSSAGTIVDDSESSTMAQPDEIGVGAVEGPSFNDVPTSTQFDTSFVPLASGPFSKAKMDGRAVEPGLKVDVPPSFADPPASTQFENPFTPLNTRPSSKTDGSRKDADDPPSFANVPTSTQLEAPTTTLSSRPNSRTAEKVVEDEKNVDGSPSFADVPTSTQFGPGRDAFGADEESENSSSLPDNIPSFRNAVQSTQMSRDFDAPFERGVRRRNSLFSASSSEVDTEKDAGSGDLPSFAGVLTSTLQQPVDSFQSGGLEGKSAPTAEILAPNSQSSPPASPTPVFRKQKRGIEDEDDGDPQDITTPSTPKRVTVTPMSMTKPSSTLTPPTTPTARTPPTNDTTLKREAAKDFYRTPTSAKRYANLADIVKPISMTRPNFTALARPTPSTPTRSSGCHLQSHGSRSKGGLQITPALGDSPFSTPPSTIRLLRVEESPHSLRKLGKAMDRSKSRTESSGLFGMDYNSQFQIEENVEEVANFLQEDIWDAEEVTSP